MVIVTVIGADVVAFWATSVATAVRVCRAIRVWPWVFHVNWYGELVSVARTVVPSSRNVTPAIPDGAPDPVPASVALAATDTVAPRR